MSEDSLPNEEIKEEHLSDGQVAHCSTDGVDHSRNLISAFSASPCTVEDGLHAPKLHFSERISWVVIGGLGIPRTALLTDFQFFNLAVERRKADVQQLGRFLAVVPNLFERAEDMLFLELA